MKREIGHYVILALLLALSHTVYAQEEQGHFDESALADSLQINLNVDFATLKLPPLSVLYANARSNPSVMILEKERQLQKKLLSKEKKAWLSFFRANGSVSYGIADNVASNTDADTPLVYRYVGSEQTSWNVGGGISIPFESLFDLGGRVNRQRIALRKAELTKEQAYDQLRQQIASLYVQILSNIETLKRSSEYLTLYKGVSAMVEQEFRNRRATIDAVASAKKQEFEANTSFEGLRSTINEQLLVLEIISHTPILTVQDTFN